MAGSHTNLRTMALANGDLNAWLENQVAEPHKFDTFSMTQDRLALFVVGKQESKLLEYLAH